MDQLVSGDFPETSWLSALSDADPSLIVRDISSLLSAVLKHARAKKLATKGLANDGDDAATIRDAFTAMMKLMVALINRAENLVEATRTLEGLSKAVVEFLPLAEFNRSVETLLLTESNDLHRVALRALLYRVDQSPTGDKASQEACLACLRWLPPVARGPTDSDIRQLALLCINRIAEKFGRAEPQRLIDLPNLILGTMDPENLDPHLGTASLVCLTTLVEALKEEFVAFAPRVLQVSTRKLDANIQEMEPHAGLHNAIYSLWNAILIFIPWTITSQALDQLLLLSHTPLESDLEAKSRSTRSDVFDSIAKELDPQECFASLARTLESATRSGLNAIQQHLRVLQMAIDKHPKSVTIAHSKQLMAFFLSTLDTRRLQQQDASKYQWTDDETVTAIEDSTYDVMIKMINKLNDTYFRPLFTKGCEWIDSPEAKKTKRGAALRGIAWYGFLQRFFGSFKSIVTSYTTYIIDSTADVLKQANTSDHRSVILLSRILATLQASLKHDQDEFWQAHDSFETILSPLTFLLAPAARHSAFHLLEPLITCITAFAVASGSQEHHRAINLALLPYLRADSAVVRLAAARCQASLTKALAEEWLVMLPEMLPFMAEALEDEDERVEKEVRSWVRDIEERTGESMDGMLQ